MKKMIRSFLSVLLGLSIMAATATVGFAAENSEYLDEIAENEFSICLEDCGYNLCDVVDVVRDEVVEIPNLSILTPSEHNEYIDDGFYIVDEIYVQADEPTSPSVNSTWKYETVTVKRSIYDNPDKTYGVLYATMVLTVEFRWNGTTAEVVGRPNYYTTKDTAGKNLEISTKEVSYKSNQGGNFLWGNKYAYAEYVITISNFPKSLNSSNTTSKDFRLYVERNRNGTPKTAN